MDDIELNLIPSSITKIINSNLFISILIKFARGVMHFVSCVDVFGVDGGLINNQ